jgi:hypothetical protein
MAELRYPFDAVSTELVTDVSDSTASDPSPTTSHKLRRYLPAIAFAAGFVWDSLTLGRTITSLDLFLLTGYFIAAATILMTIGRGIQFRYSHYLNMALQFFFGGMFSALVIFYFLSASALPGYAVVLGLAALLVLNEFLEERYSRLTLSWTVFAVCGVMFFNFALPHLFRSISIAWFYLSTLIAIVLVVALWRTSRQEKSSIVPALGVAGALLIAHAANLIPPVPLVKKQMVLAHGLTRRGDAYAMRVERPPLWKPWQTSSNVLHWRSGTRVYCFTSVFVPRGISTRITHRWEYFDPAAKKWVGTTTLTFPIRGGRREGFRGYTWKQNLTPGRWRVMAESESGATIGILRFVVVRGAPRGMKRLVL